MGRRRVAGVAGVAGGLASLVLACGLGLEGLGDTSGAGGADAGAGVDVTSTDTPDATEQDVTADVTADATVADTGAPDAGTPDAPQIDSPAAPPADAACPGVVCQGQCTTAHDCSSCAGATLLCPGTGACTTDCTACPSSPIQCFVCNSQGADPVGTCQADDPTGYCLDGVYDASYPSGEGQRCTCTLSSDCPGATQTCLAIGAGAELFQCYTCGEAFTAGSTCNGGGQCNEPKATCK